MIINLLITFNKIILRYWLVFFLVVPASAQKLITLDSTKIETLRIDPSNAIGGNVSDFFTNVEFIPLETTKESTFGSVTKLEITDDYFILLDDNTHSILIFTKEGKFHAKIKSAESGGSYIYSFSINRWIHQIIFSRDNDKTLTYCDYDGKIVKTIKLGGQHASDETQSPEIYFFEPNKGIASYSYNNIDSISKDYKTYSRSLIVYANDNRKVYAQGLHYGNDESELDIISSGLGPITKFGVDTTFFYSKIYDFTVYTITPNTIKLSYKFIFPLNSSIPDDFVGNKIYKHKHIEYLQKNGHAIFGLSNFFRIGENLIFKTNMLNSGTKEDNLIYNLKSGSLIAYKHILQDSLSYFLPIYEASGWTFNDVGLLACKDGYLYTSLSSLQMFKSHDENTDQKPNYPVNLKAYFAKADKTDNPVLVRVKLKTEL